MKSIVYTRGDIRPSLGLKGKILINLNRLSVIRNISFIKKLIHKFFNMPMDCLFSSKFYCTSNKLIVGRNVGLADTFIIASAEVKIGDNCSFSYRNMIITSTHDLNNFSIIISKPITIGSNVWITTNVTILPGVNIGNNSIIGAGSVVTKDIPSGVFAAGNPCKVLRQITFNK